MIYTDKATEIFVRKAISNYIRCNYNNNFNDIYNLKYYYGSWESPQLDFYDYNKGAKLTIEADVDLYYNETINIILELNKKEIYFLCSLY